MKKIYLTTGETCFVDDEDYDAMNAFNWRKGGDYGRYAVRTTDLIINGRRVVKAIWMHREILKMVRRKTIRIVDHINGNGLDNQKCNLRIVNHQKNCLNRAPKTNTKYGYKGVGLRKDRGTFEFELFANGKRIKRSGFKTAEDAARAYDQMALKYHGKYAWLNKVG